MNRSHVGRNRRLGLLAALGVFVSSCAVTLTWLVAFAIAVVVADVDWLFLALLVGSILALLSAALYAPVDSTRLSARKVLPVWGDWLRYQKRDARRMGNQWLRDAGLVRDSVADEPVDYEVYAWSDCVEIQNLPVVGVTDGRIRKVAEESLAYWHAADCEVIKTGHAGWLIRLFDTSRLDMLRKPRVLAGLPEAMARVDKDGGHLLLRIGRTLSGDAWLDCAGVAGVLLAGQPGMGKTAAVDIILASVLARPDLTDVYVIDGKGGEDLAWAQSRCKAWSNDDGFDASLEMLRAVHDLMRDRLKTNRQKYGDSNGWHTFGRTDMQFVLLVIDEVQSYTGAVSKDCKERQAEFVRLLMDLVKKGRSACITTVCATQKPTTDAIPTGLRDEMAKRYCFRVPTSEMARAALGVIPDSGPTPVDIPFTSKGLAVGTSDDGGLEYIQFDYLPEESLSFTPHDKA